MRNLIKLLILLFGVSIYSQDTLSVKDGAYGYDKDFVIDVDLKTETKIGMVLNLIIYQLTVLIKKD